jgi:hypothetical protein
MEPPAYNLTSHDRSAFHHPPNLDQATPIASCRPKNAAHHLVDQLKSNQRLELDFQSVINDCEKSLAPIDGGFSAWRFVFMSFLVEGFVWGTFSCL